jgi:hypothetical protein
MTSQLDATILKISVRTATGAHREHLLDLGIGKRKAILERMRSKMAAIEACLHAGAPIPLANPAITYNGLHVESVEYEVTGLSQIAAEIREAMADSLRAVGFGRPSANEPEGERG